MKKENRYASEFIFKCSCGEEHLLAYGAYSPIVSVQLYLSFMDSVEQLVEQEFQNNEYKILYECRECKNIFSFIVRRLLLY